MKKESFKKQATKSLSKCKITKNKNGTINVIGNLTISFPLQYLPKINKLIGNFDCSYNNHLKSLKGSPKNIIGHFDCSHCNKLETLKGAPLNVSQNFNCSLCNAIKTLEGAPKTVCGNFHCCNCLALKTLKGVPKTIGFTIYLNNCNSLPSNEITSWLKEQTISKQRANLETSSSNQAESTWKHLK